MTRAPSAPEIADGGSPRIDTGGNEKSAKKEKKEKKRDKAKGKSQPDKELDDRGKTKKKTKRVGSLVIDTFPPLGRTDV